MIPAVRRGLAPSVNVNISQSSGWTKAQPYGGGLLPPPTIISTRAADGGKPPSQRQQRLHSASPHSPLEMGYSVRTLVYLTPHLKRGSVKPGGEGMSSKVGGLRRLLRIKTSMQQPPQYPTGTSSRPTTALCFLYPVS